MPEISIVVPVYRAENYLNRCVDSILRQSFADFELILVDDGSPDGCPAICDEYADREPRIRAVHQKNAGVSAARNKGIELATGSYLMVCDSDDYVEPDWCITMLEMAKRYPDHGIICNAWEEEINGVIIKNKASEENLDKKYTNISYLQLYKKSVSGSACLQIFDRRKLQELGINFETGRPIGEDAIFCSRYLAKCSGYVFVARPLYHYVNNENSAMHRYYPNLLALTLPLFEERLPLLDDSDTAEFADIYFYIFMNLLDNCFDKRNSMSFFKKLSYNHKMMQSSQFQKCVQQMSGKNENPLVCKIARTQNYYLYFLFQQLLKIKNFKKSGT